MKINVLGRCSQGVRCIYLHDPSKVALCTQFLKGVCSKGDKCLLSHQITDEKLPLCNYFLKGFCTNESCKFLHLNVDANAPICESFSKFGYCNKGRSCEHQHFREQKSKPRTTSDSAPEVAKMKDPQSDSGFIYLKEEESIQETNNPAENDSILPSFLLDEK